MLLNTTRVKLLEKVNLHGATMHGNRGFNGDEHFEFCDDHDVDSVDTCKRAPPLPFVFGNAKHKTKTVQKKTSECGPKTVYGARRQLSKNSRESHLTLCRTGTGRCVMLTSTKPGMDGSQWNIVPRSTRAMKIFAKGRQEQRNVTPTLADNTPLTTNTNASRSSATTITTLSSTSPKKAAQLKPTKVLKCAPTKADAGQPTKALKKKKEVLKKAAARQPKKALKKKKKVLKHVAPTRRFTRSARAIEPCFTGDVKEFIQDLWVAKKGVPSCH